MKRRQVLWSVIAAVAGSAAPFGSLAQSPTKVWRIGVLHPWSRRAPGDHDGYTMFFEGLRDLGYVDGRNIAVQWQFADNNLQRLPDLAAQLVKSKVDLIVTNGTPAVGAAQAATTTIPIVALTFGEPIARGFAKSLARPGGNITGIAIFGVELTVKRLEILVEMVPHVTRIAYLRNPDNPSLMSSVSVLEQSARKAKKEIVIVNARGENELNAAFAQIVRDRAGAVLVASDTVFIDHLQRIGELALQHTSMFGFGMRTAEHGLVNYAQDGRQTSRSAAMMAVKIFKGAKAADIPIEQPTHLDFMVNLKTAKALGITIPPAVLVQATRVIE